MSTHQLWDTYLRLIAAGMSEPATRAKLAELFPEDASRVGTIIAARGDMAGNPDPEGLNAAIRQKALGGRVTVELAREQLEQLGTSKG